VKARLHISRILVLAGCFCSSVSTAQDDAARLNQEDARLNQVYQRRVTQLRNDPTKLTELRRQESEWIKQRDQKYGEDVTCLTEATKVRADYFEQLVAQEETKGQPVPQIPRELLGRWLISKVLPVNTVACLDNQQAQALVGTEIEYRADSFRWKTTTVRILKSSSKMIGALEFNRDNSGSGSHADFGQLGIAASAVKQITIRHPDVTISELAQSGSHVMPGESVLVEAPNTIIFDICNTYFEARRE
jgi:hypothetical protein